MFGTHHNAAVQLIVVVRADHRSCIGAWHFPTDIVRVTALFVSGLFVFSCQWARLMWAAAGRKA